MSRVDNFYKEYPELEAYREDEGLNRIILTNSICKSNADILKDCILPIIEEDYIFNSISIYPCLDDTPDKIKIIKSRFDSLIKCKGFIEEENIGIIVNYPERILESNVVYGYIYDSIKFTLNTMGKNACEFNKGYLKIYYFRKNSRLYKNSDYNVKLRLWQYITKLNRLLSEYSYYYYNKETSTLDLSYYSMLVNKYFKIPKLEITKILLAYRNSIKLLSYNFININNSQVEHNNSEYVILFKPLDKFYLDFNEDSDSNDKDVEVLLDINLLKKLYFGNYNISCDQMCNYYKKLLSDRDALEAFLFYIMIIDIHKGNKRHKYISNVFLNIVLGNNYKLDIINENFDIMNITIKILDIEVFYE